MDFLRRERQQLLLNKEEGKLGRQIESAFLKQLVPELPYRLEGQIL